MNCGCGGTTRVIDTRPHDGGIRRRRQCEACGARFSTQEQRAREQKLAAPQKVKKAKPGDARRRLETLRDKGAEWTGYDD